MRSSSTTAAASCSISAGSNSSSMARVSQSSLATASGAEFVAGGVGEVEDGLAAVGGIGRPGDQARIFQCVNDFRHRLRPYAGGVGQFGGGRGPALFEPDEYRALRFGEIATLGLGPQLPKESADGDTEVTGHRGRCHNGLSAHTPILPFY